MKLRKVIAFWTALGWAWTPLSAIQKPSDAPLGDSRMEPYESFYEGVVGNKPVGFRFVIEKQRPKSSAYYQGPDWREIPLTLIDQQKGKIVLKTADGNMLRLDFFYDESTGAQDFYDSIGLRGVMETPTGSVPVKITGLWSRFGGLGGPVYGLTGADSDEAFERNVRGFVAAVLADRPTEAANYTSFPLRSDFCRRSIRNAAELKRNWSWLFPKQFKADIAKSVLHNLPTDSHSDEAFLLSGMIYFDNSGATLVRPSKCPPRIRRKSVRR